MLSAVAPGKLSVDSPKLFMGGGKKISYSYDISMDPTLANRPGLVFFNALADSVPDGTNPILPELAVLLPFSTPKGLFFTLPAVLGTTPVSFNTPVYPYYKKGEGFRFQTVYYEPKASGLQVIPTNQVKFFYTTPVKIRVKAEGSTTFNSVTSSGFWSVRNFTHLPIIEVTFDFTASSSTHANNAFDTDQSGMADEFWFGNSTVAGSKGTYRNGSDKACGLVYDSQNTYKNPHPDPTVTNANCGFIATNKTSGNTYQTIKFRFQASPPTFVPGKKFEFDADTDGGPADGSGMDGVAVVIKLSNNTVLKGRLKKDATKNMSKIDF